MKLTKPTHLFHLMFGFNFKVSIDEEFQVDWIGVTIRVNCDRNYGVRFVYLEFQCLVHCLTDTSLCHHLFIMTDYGNSVEPQSLPALVDSEDHFRDLLLYLSDNCRLVRVK